MYYQSKEVLIGNELEQLIIRIFKDSRNNYRTRKIKHILITHGCNVSGSKIARIMNKHGLVSNYTIKHYKVHRSSVNKAKINNVVNQDFNDRKR